MQRENVEQFVNRTGKGIFLSLHRQMCTRDLKAMQLVLCGELAQLVAPNTGTGSYISGAKSLSIVSAPARDSHGSRGGHRFHQHARAEQKKKKNIHVIQMQYTFYYCKHLACFTSLQVDWTWEKSRKNCRDEIKLVLDNLAMHLHET